MTPATNNICTARRQNGDPCRASAIRGGTVCSVHGGRAPQVVAAAKRRLALAADVVAARLVGVALKRNARDSDVIAACKDVLDRAGVHAEGDVQGVSGASVEAKINVVFVWPEARPDSMNQ